MIDESEQSNPKYVNFPNSAKIEFHYKDMTRKTESKTTYVCDRCKKEYKTTDENPNSHEWVWSRGIMTFPFDKEDPDTLYDLCPECLESYRKWKNELH